jgi:hypothetical protein
MPEPSPPPSQARPSDISPALWAKIVEQGVADTATLEHLYGAGKDLWETDAEFEQFLETIRATRAQRE